MVLLVSAPSPSAVFLPPVVLLASALKPLAVLLSAGGVASRAHCHRWPCCCSGVENERTDTVGRVEGAGGVAMSDRNPTAVLIPPSLRLKGRIRPAAVLPPGNNLPVRDDRLRSW